MTPKNLAKKIAQFALSKKAHAVTIMDLRKVTDMADFFVVCSADSDVQVRAIADAVTEGTDTIGVNAWHREGLSQRQWVLIDYVDVVVHVFHKEMRKYYGLEKLWGDAKSEVVEDTSATGIRSPKAATRIRSKTPSKSTVRTARARKSA